MKIFLLLPFYFGINLFAVCDPSDTECNARHQEVIQKLNVQSPPIIASFESIFPQPAIRTDPALVPHINADGINANAVQSGERVLYLFDRFTDIKPDAKLLQDYIHLLSMKPYEEVAAQIKAMHGNGKDKENLQPSGTDPNRFEICSKKYAGHDGVTENVNLFKSYLECIK